jgi:hypothetical protein
MNTNLNLKSYYKRGKSKKRKRTKEYVTHNLVIPIKKPEQALMDSGEIRRGFSFLFLPIQAASFVNP